MWITNGCINDEELGDRYLIYARTTEGTKSDGVSMFLVEKGYEGFSLGSRIKDKLGMRASNTAELVFENCVVPAENLVGNEGGAVMCMMRNLEIERLVLAAMSLGIAKRSIEVMNNYAQERKAFGQPLNRYGQIQRHIAETYANFMAGRAFVYDTAAKLELDSTGNRYVSLLPSADFFLLCKCDILFLNRLDTDAVKLFCGNMGKQAADRAIQVLGGNGYVGEYQVERLWRDAKLLEIGGGTNESHEKNMTRDLANMDYIQ